MKFNKVTLFKPKGMNYWCFKIPTWAKPTKRHFNTHQTTREEAEKVRDNLLSQRNAQTYNQVYNDSYLNEAIETYLLSKKNLAKKSYTAYKATVNEFKDYIVSKLGKIPRLQEIGIPSCEAYLQSLIDRGLNPHTRNDRRNILTNLFKYCVDNNWINNNPVTKIKKIKELPSNSPAPLSIEEVETLLNGLKNTAYYEIMSIIYYAGLRVSEVTHLFKIDIDFNLSQILVHSKKIGNEMYYTKTRKDRQVVMIDKLKVILKAWLVKNKNNSDLLFPSSTGNPIKTDLIYNAVKKTMIKLEFPLDKVTSCLHRGRHTFTSIATVGGIEEALIQKALGHSTPTMTRHYTHLSPEYVKNKFNNIYGQNKEGKV